MWFVTMLFVYGVKGVWLLWVWPLFNVVFRMIYLGPWVRRSQVLTGAEWMRTRFGQGRGAELAYLSVVLYALVSVVGFLSYAFQGIGKFAAPFFPWDLPHEAYGTVILLVTGLYCVVGGMYSVVMNDLIQFGLILATAVVVAAIAIVQTTPEQILTRVPAGWDDLFFGWQLRLDWSALIPAIQDKLYQPVSQGGDGYALFGFFILMLFVKGVLVSLAGPTPNYAIQHVLSTRSPREAALENLMMALVSLGPRFLLIAGITVIGLVFFRPEDFTEVTRHGKVVVDFEKVLPNVVRDYLPVGCRGLMLAGLLAAFMSTFVSTVNSGAAYVVNDLYRRYLRPDASPRQLVRLGYVVSVAVILLGIAFGFFTKSVHNVTEWIVSALVPAFVAPNVLKWHWWRFNGHGFFAGMAAGTAGALLKAYLPVHPVFGFLLILGVSFAASVVVCLLTSPEPEAVLTRFYRTVRPWGWWAPVLARCRAETPGFEPNRDLRRDAFNLGVGIVWQVSMVAAPIYLVIQQYGRLALALLVFAGTSLILKFTWYDRLGPGEMYLAEDR
jgi:Na+/proline symporter